MAELAHPPRKKIEVPMNIVQSPDPILRQVCDPCELGDKSLKKLSRQMARLMYKYNGCGIAGPQVGVLKRIIVIDCDQSTRKDPITLINPEIVELRGEDETSGEGCLSLPGITVPITRKTWAKVKYLDLDFRERYIEGDGLLGCCLQHEIDHLDGKTLIESCDPVVRMDVLRQYQAALAAGARPGDTGEEE